jgi:hypothetical protein
MPQMADLTTVKKSGRDNKYRLHRKGGECRRSHSSYLEIDNDRYGPIAQPYAKSHFEAERRWKGEKGRSCLHVPPDGCCVRWFHFRREPVPVLWIGSGPARDAAAGHQ